MNRKEWKGEYCSSDTLDKYVDQFDTMTQGERNNGLLKKGLLLRKKFGLADDALKSKLSEVNQTKCSPPLSESEVTKIARSVDRANIPLGDSIELSIAPNKQRRRVSKPEPLYYVSTKAEPIDVEEILCKEISVYLGCTSNTPCGVMSIGDVLEAFKTGEIFADEIDMIRKEIDEEKRKKLKKELLTGAVFGSEPQTKRKAEFCKANGVLGVDLDDIPPENIKEVKAEIARLGYVFAVCRSASGTGLFALVAYAGTPDLKNLLTAMQADFPYKIDMACSDLSRLRFYTRDRRLILKEKVHPAVLNEVTADDDEQKRSPLEFEPFPVDALSKSLRRYVVEAAKARMIDPCYVGPFSLAAIASVIGSGIWIRLTSEWTEPASLWVGVVGETGSGKSPGMDASMEPLNNLQKQIDMHYRDAEQAFRKKQMLYEADCSQWKSRRKKDEELEPPEKPEAPNPITYIVEDTTTEAMIEIWQHNPFGVGMQQDEMGGWMGCFDTYRSGGGSKDLPFWLKSHGCRAVRVHRKGKPPVFALTPAVSILGGIQPGILRMILNANKHFFDAGLAARILLAMPPDRARRLTGYAVSEATKDAYREIFTTILSWRSGENPVNPEKPKIVKLSDEAKTLFWEYHNANDEERVAMASGLQKGFWPKLTGYAARIALVLHIVRWVEGDTPKFQVVEGDTMEAAIRIVQWFKRETFRIVETMCGESAQTDMDTTVILDVIRNNGGKITLRKLAQGPSVFRGPEGYAYAEKMLRELVKKKVLRVCMERSNSGTGKEVFSIFTTD